MAWPDGGARACGWSKTLRGQPAAAQAQAAPAPVHGRAARRRQGKGREASGARRQRTSLQRAHAPCGSRRAGIVGPAPRFCPLFLCGAPSACVTTAGVRIPRNAGPSRARGVALAVCCAVRAWVLGRSGFRVGRAEQQGRDARALLNGLTHTLRWPAAAAPPFGARHLFGTPLAPAGMRRCCGRPPLTQHRHGGAGRVPPLVRRGTTAD